MFDGKSRLATMVKWEKECCEPVGLFWNVLREWQDSKCDIIDKYNANDVQKLKNEMQSFNFIKFEKLQAWWRNEYDNIGYIFSMDMPQILLMKKNLLIKKCYDESESEDDIDVDDIWINILYY